MKLAELYTKPLCDVLKEMKMADMKIHTDDNGSMEAIEIKYVPNEMKVKVNRKSDFEF